MRLNYLASLLIVIVASLLEIPAYSQSQLIISDLGKNYAWKEQKLKPGLYFHIPTELVNHGNTSIRNEAEASLVWKGSPDSNGFGYFQRNRDMGQVFNVPEGENVQLDALVLRTSKGENAMMAGAPNAEMYVVFFEVKTKKGQELRINENGTSKGDLATHGFDHQFNRCDDFIEGDEYVFLHRASGGVLPEMPVTTHPEYKREGKLSGEQDGHLRYIRFDFQGNSELVLEAGKRYAFMVGFAEPGKDRGIAWSISTEVHQKEKAEFVRDENGLVKWGIRREGDGSVPPTMIQNSQPPTDQKQYRKLVSESLFPSNHFETLKPTTDGYPDVDTYRTMEFYLELKK
ncbi:hypothetical protein JYB64_11960 [Algoriphagus aestuarii]|nr:hypothetical protein [Algoriphagus aestuarii]